MCLWGLSIPSLGKYATPTAVLFNFDVIYSSQDQQTFLFRIDYLNIRGLKGKIQEVNKHLEEKSPDVFCLVETFLKTDNKPGDLQPL
jgi:hypothetical protein